MIGHSATKKRGARDVQTPGDVRVFIGMVLLGERPIGSL